MNNFRQILSNVDVASVLDQIRDIEWSADQSWKEGKSTVSKIYDVDTIALRAVWPHIDRPRTWTRPVFDQIPAAQTIVWDLMQAVKGEWLGNVCITRLWPGQIIEEHTDETPNLDPPFFQRYQVPLLVERECVFRCGGEELWMQPTTAWWFNNQLPHSVDNHRSPRVRISMRVDIRPYGGRP